MALSCDMSEKYKVGESQIPHFITTTIVDWVDLFTRPVYKDIIIDSLQHCSANKGLIVHAYCVMPSHLHLILSTEEDVLLQDVMRDFKKFTSKQLIKAIEQVGESRKEWMLKKFAFAAKRIRRGVSYKVWQDGFHPVELSTIAIMEQKLEYTHMNPVVEGYVFAGEDWVYSSAAHYAGRIEEQMVALQMLL